MNVFYKAYRALKAGAPFIKSAYNAYKDTVKDNPPPKNQKQSESMFSSLLSKANLVGPPLSEAVALQILGIQKDPAKQVEPRKILERYYILYKKNDPEGEGTIYLRSKISEAKRVLLASVPNGKELEDQFNEQMKKIQSEKQKQEQSAKKEKQEK